MVIPEGFRYIVERPELHRVHRRLDGAESRDHYDRQIRNQASQLILQLVSAHAAHPEIGDQCVRNFPLYDLECLSAGIGADRAIARLPQYVADKVDHVTIVINDKDCCLILTHLALSVSAPATRGAPLEMMGIEIVKRVPAGPV